VQSTMTSVPSSRVSPAEAALSRAVAGLIATILVSVLARSTPGIRTQAFYKRRENQREIPDEQSEHPAMVTPAGALAQAHGPGPEGAAGLFAMKVASGLFGRDIARSSRLWGKVVHLAYGSFWGMVYGILQGPRRRQPVLAGPLHGLFVWSLGPGWLVPAMKLMHPPTEAPPAQTWLNLVGHVLYGVTVAELFDAQSKRRN